MVSPRVTADTEPASFSALTTSAFSGATSIRAPAATRRASWSCAKPKMSAPPSTSVIMLAAASPSPTGSTVTVMPAYSGYSALKFSICCRVKSTVASATQTLISPLKPSALAQPTMDSTITRERTMARNFFMGCPPSNFRAFTHPFLWDKGAYPPSLWLV